MIQIGDDLLDGGEGDDTYLFTAGDSPASEDGANETIADTAGNNTVVFETATADDLTLYIGNNAPQEAPLGGGEYLVIDYAGEDRLLVQGGFDGAVATYEFSDGERLSYAELIGRMLEGLWYRSGTGGTAAIGGTGNDQIETLEGGAFLSGGRGNDTLTASGGGNTYLYGAGDGTDTITDTSKAAGFMAANTLRFGSGIKQEDIRLRLGSLLIQVGDDPANAIHIAGFNPDDVLAQRPIDRFEFADAPQAKGPMAQASLGGGTVLSYEELLARGFDLDGSGEEVNGMRKQTRRVPNAQLAMNDNNWRQVA